jgi:hypothetical protein
MTKGCGAAKAEHASAPTSKLHSLLTQISSAADHNFFWCFVIAFLQTQHKMTLLRSLALALAISSASASIRASSSPRMLSYETIGDGYTPTSKVTDHVCSLMSSELIIMQCSG